MKLRALAPVALAVLVMLPRLASPQFGLLDDGLTLQVGREVIGRWSSTLHLIPETGRFFPAYWLVYSAIVGIVGARPLAFFVVNTLLLAGLVLILTRLVKLSEGTQLPAAIAAVMFASCGPAIETFYTLSKAEALQLTWIGLSILITASSIDARLLPRAGLLMAAGVCLLLAQATKETSMVLLPVSLAWLAIEWWSSRQGGGGLRFAVSYVCINLIAAASFAVLRWHYAPLGLAQGTYTRAYGLGFETIAAALFRISAWLVRDFVFLLPILLAVPLALLHGRPASRRPVLYACVWMAGWLAVYLPWPTTFEYHLLPFAFGAAVLAGTVAGDCWVWRRRAHPAMHRRIACTVLLVAGCLWLPPLLSAVTDARVQLTVDRSNAEVVDFLARLPINSRVVVNTSLNEYVVELPMHLSEIKRRPDVVVEHASGAPPVGSGLAELFVVTPLLANPPTPTVRFPLDEEGTRRGHAMLTTLLAGRGDLVYRTERHAALTELRLHGLLCPVTGSGRLGASYCPGDRGLIDRRRFLYGWQVHRRRPPTVDHAEGRHAD
jgi:hypothetical protein